MIHLGEVRIMTNRSGMTSQNAPHIRVRPKKFHNLGVNLLLPLSNGPLMGAIMFPTRHLEISGHILGLLQLGEYDWLVVARGLGCC